MSKEIKRSFLESVGNAAIEGSSALSEELPQWIRPIIRIIIFIFLLIVFFMFIPIGIIYKFFRKNNTDPYFKLRTELDTKWRSGSKDDAIMELRRIREQIKINLHKLGFSGYLIEPYGKFKLADYFSVLWMLYHWEYHLNNYSEANDICDEILTTIPQENIKKYQFYDEWIVNKARVLLKEKGIIASKEYLLRYLNPDNEDSAITKYYHELRDAS